VDGLVQILNPAARRMLGVAGDPSAQSFRALVGPPAGALADLIRSTAPGTATHLGVSVSPMLNEPGVLQGAICLFTDLSAVVELEERLRLQDSLARVGELTAGIAHEFRNGLATIHGYGRLIVPEQLPEKYRPYLAGIRQETVALREVVDNFLRFARPSELSLATVSLVQRVAEEIRSEARERGGEVRIEGAFPDVEGDDVRLRQPISNLCRNAVDACVEAGVVPVVTLASEVDATDDTVRITVTDNGPGFDPATRDQIFTPFFTTKSTGTGLGLALTQKIIVTHNGRVNAIMTPGGGACMEVVLPLHSVAHRT
jgi:signal transduction histidine kinase